mmetsp:Transcript_16292/g.22846  ORF Transcript_16292/g.22846 Transcript_16292/m.22846 type:complete len:240 (+) Transcript_16292:91-810(+)|eukprot:CAMPEP_0185264026 /NCGR_PEP_ID=MMETSP1359-20130426/17048_1 /TAXON_ID=552665 /ORGANISM="Bigelowiella longifila, Strain CCMP242" /LENGTH=239 /DNA_ID=CAMNT_0027851977 /DNA_START=36 /DNA_END=755 /DNA_ORIENTATION=-
MDEITPLLDKKEVLSQCEKVFYFSLGTLALAGGIGSTTIASLNLLTDFTNFPLHAYAIFFGLVITVLEANRFLAHPPLAQYMKNAVKFQMLIEEYCRLFATAWGRALLYLFEAFLLLTSGGWLDWLGFLYMVTLSAFAILLAVSTGKKLNSLKDVMKEMSRGTSMNDVEFIQKKFDEWDKDNSGHIDSAELRDLCIACGIPLSGSEAEVAYNILDTDRNGKIDKREFVVWWKTQSRAWA